LADWLNSSELIGSVAIGAFAWLVKSLAQQNKEEREREQKRKDDFLKVAWELQTIIARRQKPGVSLDELRKEFYKKLAELHPYLLMHFNDSELETNLKELVDAFESYKERANLNEPLSKIIRSVVSRPTTHSRLERIFDRSYIIDGVIDASWVVIITVLILAIFSSIMAGIYAFFVTKDMYAVLHACTALIVSIILFGFILWGVPKLSRKK
jgi:hypothetical protein